MIQKANKIVISRTDSIGDVVLTLPLAGILKKQFPEAQLIFLGNTYTKAIIKCCPYVDEIWEWSKIEKQSTSEQTNWLKNQDVDCFIHVFPRKELALLAKKAGIKNRIGTSHRFYHLLNCNHRPNFSRKNSNLHEAQLNVKLLAPFGISQEFTLQQLNNFIKFKNPYPLPEKFKALLNPNKRNIILHAKSQGSAIEWGVKNYITLSNQLNPDLFEIFFTGTEKEASYFRDQLNPANNIHDLSGKMTLEELIAFINHCDILLAASTGPLHIAAISNICAIGLFSSRRPIHAERWRPVGDKVKIFEDKNLEKNQSSLKISIEAIKEFLITI